MHNHDEFMRHAIELAANVPDRPFGVVIVDQRSGEILSEGWNKSSMNPIWHGEIDAINRLVEAGHDWKSKSLTLYTTAEPCPMCQGGDSLDGYRNSGLWHVDSIFAKSGLEAV